MRSLRHIFGRRRGESDRHSFAFFVVGALVVIAVAVLLGFQLGRYIEKSAVKGEPPERNVGKGYPGDNGFRAATPADIRKDISAFSEEAVKIPAVSPPPADLPTAGEDLRRTEAEATFPETLSRKDPSPDPLATKKEKSKVPPPAVGKKFYLQAGAMKTKETAEEMRKRLEKKGHRTIVSRVANPKLGTVFRVRVGPFDTREEALKAMKAIRTDMKIDVILLQG